MGMTFVGRCSGDRAEQEPIKVPGVSEAARSLAANPGPQGFWPRPKKLQKPISSAMLYL